MTDTLAYLTTHIHPHSSRITARFGALVEDGGAAPITALDAEDLAALERVAGVAEALVAIAAAISAREELGEAERAETEASVATFTRVHVELTLLARELRDHLEARHA